MAETTFRDFAGAIMGNDSARAAEVLSDLLGLPAATATAGTTHFLSSAKADPSFTMKAMGLRAAVTTGTDAEVASLLKDCFDLGDPEITVAVEALRKRYSAPT